MEQLVMPTCAFNDEIHNSEHVGKLSRMIGSHLQSHACIESVLLWNNSYVIMSMLRARYPEVNASIVDPASISIAVDKVNVTLHYNLV